MLLLLVDVVSLLQFNSNHRNDDTNFTVAMICYCGVGVANHTLKNQITSASVIIAVDSGLDYLAKSGIIADYAIGDFDSLSDLTLLNTGVKQKVITLPTDKNETDLRAGIDFALTEFPDSTVYEIYTDFSGRIDQQIGVISQLLYLQQQNKKSIIYSATQILYLLNPGLHQIKPHKNHQYISFISLSDRVIFNYSEGLQYQLNNLSIELLSETGISNQIISEYARINLNLGIALCVETINIESAT